MDSEFPTLSSGDTKLNMLDVENILLSSWEHKLSYNHLPNQISQKYDSKTHQDLCRWGLQVRLGHTVESQRKNTDQPLVE